MPGFLELTNDVQLHAKVLARWDKDVITSTWMSGQGRTSAAPHRWREYIWLPSNDNGNDSMAEEMGIAANDNGAVDLPLAVIEGANLYHIHSDHLGRPVRMTDTAKATVWAATYKPFGEVQSITGTLAQNLRFPGQYFQIETNLAYNWHRHYDPVTGRYTQPDPLRFVDGPSIYAYAGSSPFMKTDREGLDVAIVIGGPTGVLGGDFTQLGNPFGHAGIGVEGHGTFSFGTGTEPGSSFSDYLNKQSEYRDSEIYEIDTTPAQDVCIANALRSAPQEIPAWYTQTCDNCASRISDALNKCGIAVPRLMQCLPVDLGMWANWTKRKRTSIPRGTSVGQSFDAYNPR